MKTLITSLLLCCSLCASQPNIVFILTDDQGYGALGAHGHPYLHTPNMDKFHQESVKFDNFYVSPTCSPTRGALLTGKHEFRIGITHTTAIRQRLALKEVTIAKLLADNDYTTGMFGKWHLGGSEGYNPDDRGFDIVSQPLDIHGGLFDRRFRRNGVIDETVGFREDIIFDDAIEFIDAQSENPFFCYLSTYSPHTPLGAPDEYIERYDQFPELQTHPNSDSHIKYMAMVDNLDWNIGRVFQKLEDEGLTEDTIIILMNDNGETWGLDVYNANMRGPKASIWHGGSRAFSMWKWGTKWQPKTSQRLTAHLDVFKTLSHYAGIELSQDFANSLDGYSLNEILESPAEQEDQVTTPPVDRYLFQHVARWSDIDTENVGNQEVYNSLIEAHREAAAGVRQGDYLLLQSLGCAHPDCVGDPSAQCERLRRIATGANTQTYTTNAQYHWGVTNGWELYDTRNDPGCNNNLATSQPDLVNRLKNAYGDWWLDISEELKFDFGAQGIVVPPQSTMYARQTNNTLSLWHLNDHEENNQWQAVNSNGSIISNPGRFEQAVKKSDLSSSAVQLLASENTSFPTQSAVNDFTIEFWLNPEGFSSNLTEQVIAEQILSTAGWRISYISAANSIRVLVRNESANFIISTSATDLSINQWSHLAISWNSQTTTLALQINNELVASEQNPSFSPLRATNIPITLLNSVSGLHPIEASIDEFRISDVAYRFHTDALSYFDKWKAERFTYQQRAMDTDALDFDADGDGYSNYQEYLFNSDPLTPNNLIKLVTISNEDGDFSRINFQAQKNGNVKYTLQSSSDLASWSNTSEDEVNLFMIDSENEASFIHDESNNTHKRHFFRVFAHE